MKESNTRILFDPDAGGHGHCGAESGDDDDDGNGDDAEDDEDKDDIDKKAAIYDGGRQQLQGILETGLKQGLRPLSILCKCSVAVCNVAVSFVRVTACSAAKRSQHLASAL